MGAGLAAGEQLPFLAGGLQALVAQPQRHGCERFWERDRAAGECDRGLPIMRHRDVGRLQRAELVDILETRSAGRHSCEESPQDRP